VFQSENGQTNRKGAAKGLGRPVGAIHQGDRPALHAEDRDLAIPTPELHRPGQSDGHAPAWLKVNAVRRAAGDAMQAIAGRPEFRLQRGISGDIPFRRGRPAIGITSGDDREVRRPIGWQRLTPEDGLPEEFSLRGIHAQKQDRATVAALSNRESDRVTSAR
jgi:hypothetical protein